MPPRSFPTETRRRRGQADSLRDQGEVMAFQLKLYQELCVEVLAAYLTRAGEVGPKRAFNERDDLPTKYREVPKLPGLPYVCVRVPTGGGKTVLAAHSVGVATRVFLQADRCVVLWLAPT